MAEPLIEDIDVPGAEEKTEYKSTKSEIALLRTITWSRGKVRVISAKTDSASPSHFSTVSV